MNIDEYYVYCYTNPTKQYNKSIDGVYLEFEPFYIGRGKNKRYEFHLKEAKKVLAGAQCFNYHKTNTIISILAENKIPSIIMIKKNLSKIKADALEKSLIKSLGKKIDKTGILTNITDGGEGGDTLSNHPNKKLGKKVINNSGANNPMYGKIGRNNPKTKKYLVVTPKADEIIVCGGNELKIFLKEILKAGPNSFYDVAKGKKAHHKLYQIFDITCDTSSNFNILTIDELLKMSPKSKYANWK